MFHLLNWNSCLCWQLLYSLNGVNALLYGNNEAVWDNSTPLCALLWCCPLMVSILHIYDKCWLYFELLLQIPSTLPGLLSSSVWKKALRTSDDPLIWQWLGCEPWYVYCVRIGIGLTCRLVNLWARVDGWETVENDIMSQQCRCCDGGGLPAKDQVLSML